MAITPPTTHYFSAPASNLGFMVEVVECLCGEHASITSGTDWQVIDSWDGTTRTAPGSGDLADCANDWVPGGGAPGAGSWIVLASQPGRVAANFQVRFINNAGTPQVQLIPYADWTVGGGSGAAPTLPSRITTAATMAVTTGTAPRAMVWDEAMFAVMVMNTADATQRQSYVGEVDQRATEANDPRPFVHFNSSAGWNASSWSRFSPIDNTTSLTGGVVMIDSTSTGSSTYPLGLFVSAVEVYYGTASHQHFAGIARHIGIGPQVTVDTKTTCGLALGDRDWLFFRPSGTSYGMRHDGTTLDADVIRMRTSYDIDPPDTYAPVIDFVTSGTITPTDSFIVDVTDDIEVGDVNIIVTYADGEDVVYSPSDFRSYYVTDSTTTPITGGTRFTLYNSHPDGWFQDFTITVHVADIAGNVTEDTSSSITVTGAVGYPTCVSDPPVITFVTTGTIASGNPVVVEITDDTSLEDVVITAEYTEGTQVVYTALGFAPGYETSTIDPIAGGSEFTLVATDGWYQNMDLHVRAIDDGGSVTTDVEAYVVTGGVGFPLTIIPGDSPVVTWITAAGTHAAANPIEVETTDDFNFEDATIWVTYSTAKHIIHSRGEFAGLYSLSSATPISGGQGFELVCNAGWYEDMTIHVLAVDEYGNTTTSTRSWTVTGGFGAPPEITPGDPPDVVFNGGSSLASTAAVSLTVSDDGALGTVTVWGEFNGLNELIYTSEGFTSNYDEDSTIVFTSDTEWELSIISESGWYDDVRVYVLVTDTAGQATTESRLYDVTGGPGIPEIPGGASDTDRPEISNIEPASLAGLRRLDPITFTVTDNAGYVLLTFVTIEYSNGQHEVVYDGRFSPLYAAASTRTSTTNGYVYRVKRAGGWDSAPKLWVTVYDTSNNPIKLAVT